MEREPIQAVIQRHVGRLLQLPGVVGIGESSDEAEPCVSVLVATDDPTVAAGIPATLDGYPVRIAVTGALRASSSTGHPIVQ